MQNTSIAEQLGYSADDRLVILHADDIGMCQATISAYAELVDFGLLSSASVMVPCGWFPAAAAYCRQHPDADMGVHITLNCEWNVYRWGPISTHDPQTGLLDDEGYCHRTIAATQAQADPAAVRVEIEAQIERAQAAGINPTHIDVHMGVVDCPQFAPAYLEAARRRNLPVLSRRDADPEALIDHIAAMPLGGDKPLALAKERLAALQPGITHFILHPAHDTPELRAIAPDWRARVADFELFMSPELRDFIAAEGLHVIGYRHLRDLLRRSS